MKKILLFIGMFLFIFNVKALTFNVDLTDIEDKGSNSLGTITKIDVANKELDLLFEEVGDEVNFELTITNSGNRAGTLREISVSGTNDKISYTNNLPENGLAINGNDTNKVTINAKVLEGITKGKTISNITITYKYDEGSCPEGEILSEDESMCLCPPGKVRNEQGVCIDPPEDKDPECEEDEIYNETKKICEKKTIDPPIENKTNKLTPSNPKTMDNIILITLLFFVSGLGIYAVLYKKLNTNKKKVAVGLITGVATLSLSFTVLAGVFGLDNLLSAIVNPITKTKEIVIKVNEEYDPVITWDGDCDITDALTPDNIFEGGSGTEEDPYQIKTANQLACFAKSVNQGTTYEGQYVKQIKNIKLNENLNDQAEAGDLSNAHLWMTAGTTYAEAPDVLPDSNDKHFDGTYDGSNYKIGGLYLTEDSVSSAPNNRRNYKGLFGYAVNATFKNIVLTDVYINTEKSTGTLLGYGQGNITIDNIKTYGNAIADGTFVSGILAYMDGNNEGRLSITNSENNINFNLQDSNYFAGIVGYITEIPDSDEPNIIIRNVTNNGNINASALTGSGGIAGYIAAYNKGVVVCDNCSNNGNVNLGAGSSFHFGGIVGDLLSKKTTFTNTHNTGNITMTDGHKPFEFGGLIGNTENTNLTIDNCYNSGNMIHESVTDEAITAGYPSTNNINYFGGFIGLISYGEYNITNSYNTGNMRLSNYDVGGLVGHAGTQEPSTIENCFNTGNIISGQNIGGIVGYARSTTIKNSYNKGNLTQYYNNVVGGIAGIAKNIDRSYNEGNIIITSITDGGGYAGGICGLTCDAITNSYNRGNITSTNRNSVNISGIYGNDSGTVTNCYNSGNITFEDGLRYDTYLYFSGISTNADPTNCYNLGDIFIRENRGGRQIWGAGITINGKAVNSVNAGNITVKFVNDGNIESHYTYLNGISLYTATDCFNAGTVSIVHDNMEPYTRDFIEARSKLKVGEINSLIGNTPSSNNKFNTDSNSKALGCYPFDTCTLEASETVGTYTSDPAPSILSIINGDNAFNDELDEDGLPTLKVFNE